MLPHRPGTLLDLGPHDREGNTYLGVHPHRHNYVYVSVCGKSFEFCETFINTSKNYIAFMRLMRSTKFWKFGSQIYIFVYPRNQQEKRRKNIQSIVIMEIYFAELEQLWNCLRTPVSSGRRKSACPQGSMVVWWNKQTLEAESRLMKTILVFVAVQSSQIGCHWC